MSRRDVFTATVVRWQDDSEQWALARDSLGRLQMRLDLEAEEFVVEGAALKQAGDLARKREPAEHRADFNSPTVRLSVTTDS